MIPHCSKSSLNQSGVSTARLGHVRTTTAALPAQSFCPDPDKIDRAEAL
jgi:hypothetical protein